MIKVHFVLAGENYFLSPLVTVIDEWWILALSRLPICTCGCGYPAAILISYSEEAVKMLLRRLMKRPCSKEAEPEVKKEVQQLYQIFGMP